jgi:hypothetical protein
LNSKSGKNDHETGKWIDYCLFHVGFLLDLLFNPEDGSAMFLWNVALLSMNYTALYNSSP